jgi:hypothetical protein
MAWIKSSSFYSTSINPYTFLFQSLSGKLRKIGIFIYINHDVTQLYKSIRHLGKFDITGQIQTFLRNYGDTDYNYVNFPLSLNSRPFKIEFEFYDANTYTYLAEHPSGYSVMLISDNIDIDIQNQQIAIVIYAIPEMVSIQDAYIEIEG